MHRRLPKRSSPFPACCAAGWLLCSLACVALPAHAEKADRDKPINYQADSGDVNYQTKIGNLVGHVVLTQGTLTIHADRLAEIRRARVRNLGTNSRRYAELMEVYDELEEAAAVHRRLGCPVIDISELSIEETAQRILRTVEGRKAEAQAAEVT